MHSRFILAVLLATGLFTSIRADDPWIGKTVLPMRPEVDTRPQPDPAEKPTAMFGPFVVLAVRGGWVQIRPGMNMETHIQMAGAVSGRSPTLPSAMDTNDLLPATPVWAPKAAFIPLAEAAAFFTARLARDPKEELSYIGRAQARMYLDDDPDAALADLDTVIRLNPSSRRARLDRANLFQQVGAYKAAIDDFSAIIKNDPKDFAAWNNRGVAWSLRGDAEPAFADVTEAIRLKPEEWDLRQSLSHLYMMTGDAAAARRVMDAAVVSFPKQAELYRARGMIRQNQEDLDGAIADFTEALRLEPTLTLALANRGWVWHLKKEHAKALADLDAVVAKGMRHAMVLNNRGLVKDALGKTEEALADLDAAAKADRAMAPMIDLSRNVLKLELTEKKVKANPKDVAALIDRSMAYLATGAMDKAWADTEAVLAIDPKNAAAYNQRASVRMGYQDMEGAAKDATEAARLDPKEVSYVHNVASCRIFVAMKDPSAANLAAALTAAEAQVRTFPASGGGFNSRGMVRMLKGETDAALADFTEAIRLVPDLQVAYGSRATLYFNRDEVDKALADQLKSAELAPTTVLNWTGLSDVYRSRKEPAKSLRAIHRALGAGGPVPSVSAQEHLVFMLSTCPRAEFRDGERAVRIGQAVCRQSQFAESGTRAALAAAFAEAGDFESAVQWQELAMLDSTIPKLLREIREGMLKGYRDKKPYRDDDPVSKHKASLKN